MQSAVLVVATSLCLSADVLIDDPAYTFDGSESIQEGRLFRDGIASTWADTKVFPGSLGTGDRLYTTWVVPVISMIVPYYAQISIDDPDSTFITAAYADAYSPSPGPTATGYLGDAGSSGNVFGNPRFFQVVVPAGAQLVIVAMEATAGAALGRSVGVLVEGFSSSDFTPLFPEAIPEPSTWMLSASALAALVGAGRLRRRKVQQQQAVQIQEEQR